MTLDVVQVGMGAWGVDWASRIVRSNARVRQRGFVVRSAERREAVRAAIGCDDEALFTSLGDALSKVRADAVIVTTGTGSHAALVREALEAGLHVLVEKPLVPTLERARELAGLAEAKKRVLMVNQNFRFFPAARLAADLVRSGSYGRLHAISVEFRRDAERTEATRARWLRSQSQPLLFDLAIHHFDLMRMVVGADARSVACTSWKPVASTFLDPSSAVATVHFDNVVAHWSGSWESQCEATPYGGRWKLDCDEAEIHWTCRGDRDLTLDADEVVVVERGRRRSLSLDKTTPFGRSAVLGAFADAVEGRTDAPYLPLGTDNIGSLAIALGAVEASQKQQTIDLTR